MPTQTIVEERAELETRRAELMQRRGEVAAMLRNEYVDGPARRELQEEQDSLTAEIRSIDGKLATLDDEARSETQARKAASIAEHTRRRESATESAIALIRERARIAAAIHDSVAHTAELVAQYRATESPTRLAVHAALGSRAQDLNLTFLVDSQLTTMLSDAARGEVRDERKTAGLIAHRSTSALEQLKREAAQ
jgi:hypothetical protein